MNKAGQLIKFAMAFNSYSSNLVSSVIILWPYSERLWQQKLGGIKRLRFNHYDNSYEDSSVAHLSERMDGHIVERMAGWSKGADNETIGLNNDIIL